jgi:hypothetical protein
VNPRPAELVVALARVFGPCYPGGMPCLRAIIRVERLSDEDFTALLAEHGLVDA